MPRLNRRVDGSGFYVTSVFTKKGVTRKVTYQVSASAVERLAAVRVRSGDEIPRNLFFELLEEGHLYIGGSGPGEEQATSAATRQTAEHTIVNPPPRRRQIPLGITDELLAPDGSLIPLDAFCAQYDGYSHEVLTRAYEAIRRRHIAALPQRLQQILVTHKPVVIRTAGQKVIVEFLPI